MRYSDSDAARAALDRFAEAARTIRTQQSAHTIGELWAMWIEERSKDSLPSTVYQYNWVPLSRAFANRYPETLTADCCRAYTRERLEQGCSAWTVHTELSRLRACLKWAAEEGHIAKRPKIWVPQHGPGRQRVLTREEAERLLVAAARNRDPHIFVFVALLLSTGARRTAILDLTWDRVDWERGTIDFDDGGERDPMHKGWRKGRATVLMTRLAREALAQAYRARTCDYVIEKGGRRIVDIKNGFRAVVEAAGLWDAADRITPHTVRHTVATLLDAANIEARRTAQLLGHADERTTRQVYTHASPETLREVVDVLDTFAALPIAERLQVGE